MLFKKGHIPWNKRLKGEEYKKHYKNGFSGTFKKGHKLTQKLWQRPKWNERLVLEKICGAELL